MKTGKIYGLYDPRDSDKTIRYVGQSVQVDVRLRQHLTTRNRTSRVANWIRRLRKQNVEPQIIIMESDVPISKLKELEAEIILRLRDSDVDLLNVRTGGGNAPGEDHPMCGRKHTESAKRKMRINHADLSGANNYGYGVPQSIEHRENISKGLQRYYANLSDEDKFVVCEFCGKVCKSRIGYITHKRFKHIIKEQDYEADED